MLLTCRCGVVNRIPSKPKTRHKCGKCRREFTPADLVHARIEPPPPNTLDEALDLINELGDSINDEAESF